MKRSLSSIGLLGILMASPAELAAQDLQPLPSPLSLADVIQIASERREEIQAARARTTAGEARPTIVSALSDPMISPSLDHLPFMLGGADVSFTIKQQIPLSGIRGHRRTSALAAVDRLRAEANRTTLDVGVQAANAYLMLQERRRHWSTSRLPLPRDVVSAANARYGSGTAPHGNSTCSWAGVFLLDSESRVRATGGAGGHNHATSTSSVRNMHDQIGACRMTRLKLAELTSGVGAPGSGPRSRGSLRSVGRSSGSGHARRRTRPWFGMCDKHRIEVDTGAERQTWIVALYWVCWGRLQALQLCPRGPGCRYL